LILRLVAHRLRGRGLSSALALRRRAVCGAIARRDPGADGVGDGILGLAAAQFSSPLQFGRERALSFDEPSMLDIG
jgi:hypothetical protein